MTDPVVEDLDRREALTRMIALAAAPAGLSLVGQLAATPARAAGNLGAQPGQGGLLHIPAAEARTGMLAEWNIQDVNNTSGPFKIAASKAAYAAAPATAARYEAKLYNFPWGTLRTLTFKKGGPVQHLITLETEIYVLSGSATLHPVYGHPETPTTIKAGDALFLPSGYLNTPSAAEDFIILQAFVGRTVREAKKAIVTESQAAVSMHADWQAGGQEHRATTVEQLRRAPKTAHRVSLKTYAAEGNSIRVATLSGGRSNAFTRTGSDAVGYVARGRIRRTEGGHAVEMAAGDAFRQKAGTSGYWEPLEETVIITTDAPATPGVSPPALV